IVRANQKKSDTQLTNLWNHMQLYSLLYTLNLEFLNHKMLLTSELNSNQLTDLIIDYIYDNYDNKIHVQGIADQFNISRSYLYKLCMRRFDKTPKEIILGLRLNNSAQLLLHTDLLIKEISNKVG